MKRRSLPPQVAATEGNGGGEGGGEVADVFFSIFVEEAADDEEQNAYAELEGEGDAHPQCHAGMSEQGGVSRRERAERKQQGPAAPQAGVTQMFHAGIRNPVDSAQRQQTKPELGADTTGRDQGNAVEHGVGQGKHPGGMGWGGVEDEVCAQKTIQQDDAEDQRRQEETAVHGWCNWRM